MRGAAAEGMYSEGHLRLQNMCIAIRSGWRETQRKIGVRCFLNLLLRTLNLPNQPSKATKLKRQVLCNAGHFEGIKKKRPHALFRENDSSGTTVN